MYQRVHICHGEKLYNTYKLHFYRQIELILSCGTQLAQI